MGGRMGVRKSFSWQYFSSIRSDTHGGTGIGVAKPIEKGDTGLSQQPDSPTGAATAAATSNPVRSLLFMSPGPSPGVPAPGPLRPAPRRARRLRDGPAAA